MGKRGANAFAHDALAYDPATQRLSDPFGARVGALRVVNRTFGGSAALDVAMRGTIEAKQLGIAAGEDFSMWKGRVLRQIAKSADARKLAGNFLQKLATLADKLPTAQVEAVLRSRLVSTALQQVFGIAVEKVIADFETARATTGGEISNAALWLSLLLAPEIASNAADGAATTWLQRGSRFEVLRSRAALAQARGLVAQSAS